MSNDMNLKTKVPFRHKNIPSYTSLPVRKGVSNSSCELKDMNLLLWIAPAKWARKTTYK